MRSLRAWPRLCTGCVWANRDSQFLPWGAFRLDDGESEPKIEGSRGGSQRCCVGDAEGGSGRWGTRAELGGASQEQWASSGGGARPQPAGPVVKPPPPGPPPPPPSQSGGASGQERWQPRGSQAAIPRPGPRPLQGGPVGASGRQRVPLSAHLCCSSQNMVMSFRVSDLQMLLGFVGRSKSGLKHELVTRALQLVQFDCSPELFKKIKELYETRYAKKSAEPVPQPHRPLDPLTMHSTYDRAGTVPRTPLTGPNIDYPVLYGKYLNGLGRLPAKTLKPEVRLVKLPFFNMLDELLKPTELGECPPPEAPSASCATDPEHFRGAAGAQGRRRACPFRELQGPPPGL